MKITSSAFADNGKIPGKYTCDGENISPPLEFHEIPKNTESLALIVDDPMAPMGIWTHWTIWNILPSVGKLDEKAIMPGSAVEGLTSFKKNGYGGPCPPKGTEHKYYFRLYALNAMLDMPAKANEAELKEAMKACIEAYAELTGIYGR